MFQIYHQYQGKEGSLKFSKATPNLSFQGKTQGLAMKYVSSGEEIYQVQGKFLSVRSGHFVLFRENVPYRAKSSDKAISTEGMCMDLYTAGLNASEDEIYRSQLLFDLPYPIWDASGERPIPYNEGQVSFTLGQISSRLESFISQVIGMESVLSSHSKNIDTQRRLAVILVKADAFIRGHFREKIRLDVLAQQVGLSKFHLLRLFKECMGYSPQEAQIHLRMEEAKKLLLETRSITSIALELGYHDAAAFSNQFRKFYQMSPREFRLDVS
ncbi:MAG: AraC family transcriptional regulator [Bacteroidota bacterium]